MRHLSLSKYHYSTYLEAVYASSKALYITAIIGAICLVKISLPAALFVGIGIVVFTAVCSILFCKVVSKVQPNPYIR